MRVLIATDAWTPQINGVVRTLQQVVAHAPRFGCEIRLISPNDFRSAPMPGYPEIRLAMATASRLRRVIEEFRPDVVHVATEGPVGLAARSASITLNLPLTTSFHTRFPEYLRARAPVPISLSYSVLRWFHRPSSGILVSTASLEKELESRGFSNLMRWTRGVDLGVYAPRKEDQQRWPRPVFLNVGRVAVEKNIEAFLSLDLPGTKVVVGDGPQRAELERRFPSAVFLGARTGAELADIYAQADVFVFPSLTDTFGIVILEAMASGLPVAAYPVMGPVDIISGTGAGALSNDLKEAALACLDLDRSVCAEVAASYTWDASMRQFFTNIDTARRNHALARSGAGAPAKAA